MGKILVVDDQFGVRRLLVEAFQDDGHEVKTAENGEEALGVLRSFEPDVILLDMKMPGMNGIETLRQIRVLNCQVPVIMMTGYGQRNHSEIMLNGLGKSGPNVITPKGKVGAENIHHNPLYCH